MKVLLINGSPNEHGCTRFALDEIARTLEENGVDTEHFWIGREPIGGCIGCGGCDKTGLCVQAGEVVNRALEAAARCDGIVLGSPVHYAGIAGNFKAFLDRFFWAGNHALKPGIAIASARRAGTTVTIDGLNKYFAISQMPIVSGTYWPMVHGNTPDEVKEDLEGLQVMRFLGRNMAWLLKSIEAGRNAGLTKPKSEPRARTNFVR